MVHGRLRLNSIIIFNPPYEMPNETLGTFQRKKLKNIILVFSS